MNLLIAVCSGKVGEAAINMKDLGVSKSLAMMRSVVGRKIKLVSLDSITNTVKIKSAAVLKMDSEGWWVCYHSRIF